MVDSYTVEVLNLGKRPVPGIQSSTTRIDGLGAATDALHRAVGALVMTGGLTVLGAEHRAEVGGDGIVAAARLTSEADGGRVEVLLRRSPADASRPAASAAAASSSDASALLRSAEDRYDDS